jgi:hypothetical protein
MTSIVTFPDFVGPSGRPKLREGDNKLLEFELAETNSALYFVVLNACFVPLQ